MNISVLDYRIEYEFIGLVWCYDDVSLANLGGAVAAFGGVVRRDMVFVRSTSGCGLRMALSQWRAYLALRSADAGYFYVHSE